MSNFEASKQTLIHVVDDDDAFRRALVRLFDNANMRSVAYRCAGEFLMQNPAEINGCVLLDLRLPGLQGLELLQTLKAREDCPPVVILTAVDDIATSVEALKAGASNYITKPICANHLFAVIEQALQLDQRQREVIEQRNILRSKYAALTGDEKTIFLGALRSRLNKQIAAELGTCERTVKARRAHMMRKVGLRCVPDLVRAARLLGISAE